MLFHVSQQPVRSKTSYCAKTEDVQLFTFKINNDISYVWWQIIILWRQHFCVQQNLYKHRLYETIWQTDYYYNNIILISVTAIIFIMKVPSPYDIEQIKILFISLVVHCNSVICSCQKTSIKISLNTWK